MLRAAEVRTAELRLRARVVDDRVPSPPADADDPGAVLRVRGDEGHAALGAGERAEVAGGRRLVAAACRGVDHEEGVGRPMKQSLRHEVDRLGELR